MTQLERLQCPNYIVGQLMPPVQGLIHQPNQKPTHQWKVLKVGGGFAIDVKPGDVVIPEKQTSVTLDGEKISMIHESWVFGVLPMNGSGTQAERLVLAPKYVLAKLVTQKLSALIEMPTTATSFWEVVKTGAHLERFPELVTGDHIAPEKHVAIVLDGGAKYGIFHEGWVLAVLPKG